MSLQFCYNTTPNIQSEAFRLLALFDEKISQTEWDTIEATIEATIADLTTKVAAVETGITGVQNALITLRLRLLEHGI